MCRDEINIYYLCGLFSICLILTIIIVITSHININNNTDKIGSDSSQIDSLGPKCGLVSWVLRLFCCFSRTATHTINETFEKYPFKLEFVLNYSSHVKRHKLIIHEFLFGDNPTRLTDKNENANIENIDSKHIKYYLSHISKSQDIMLRVHCLHYQTK